MEKKPGPLFDEAGEPRFLQLMVELDAIKETVASGLVFRRDYKHRRSPNPVPWITDRKNLRYFRRVVKKIVAAAGIRSELSFTSFGHGGFNRRRQERSHGCRAANRGTLSIDTPAADLCQAHAKTADRRLQDAPRRANKGSPLVGTAI
jgi:hypothetical protein